MFTDSPLYKRYFGRQAKDVREADKEQARAAAMKKDFVSHGYFRMFSAWLTNEIRTNEPMASSHENMLYLCGVRDGLRRVEDHFRGVEEQESA